MDVPCEQEEGTRLLSGGNVIGFAAVAAVPPVELRVQQEQVPAFPAQRGRRHA